MNSMDTHRRKEILFGAGFVVIVVALMIFAGVMSAGRSTSTTPYVGTQTSAITADDHTRGSLTAKVSVIEYGDFQCPACGAYEPVIQKLEAEYGNKVTFVFRNFPLPMHQNSMIAAQAAEAAGMQGKYWEMHDLLYAKQSEWSDAPNTSVVARFFNTYAQSLGINVQKFDTDIQSDTVKTRIQRDISMANTAQVDHTPTFFINLTQIQNPQGYDSFKTILDAALANGGQ